MENKIYFEGLSFSKEQYEELLKEQKMLEALANQIKEDK